MLLVLQHVECLQQGLKKVKQIVDGVKQKFESNGPLRIKRLSNSNPSAEILWGPPLPASLKPPDNVCVSAFTKLPPVFGFGAISPIAPLSIF